MVVARRVLAAAGGLTTILLAGCAMTHTRTASAVDGLERRAEAFADGACREPTAACPTGRSLPAAVQFAYQAHELRRTLDNAGDPGVVLAFQQLWRSYHTLRDEVYGLHDRQLRIELKPLTRAFVDVQRQVKNAYSYADPTLYASGGYTFDPYYN